jgi:hypothetical protein
MPLLNNSHKQHSVISSSALFPIRDDTSCSKQLSGVHKAEDKVAVNDETCEVEWRQQLLHYIIPVAVKLDFHDCDV